MAIRKKHFLYIGTFQLPDKNAAALRVLGTAKLLRHIGYEVEFLDLAKSSNSNCCESIHDVFGFKTYSIRYPQCFQEWLSHALYPEGVETVLNTRDDWCGIIAYNYPGVALLYLRWLCHKRNLKLIADCTEWYENIWNFSVHLTATNVDSFIRMRIAQKQCHGMIAISEYLMNFYAKYIPCVVLPPLIDIKDKKWTSLRSKQKDQALKLFYVGSPGNGMQKDKLDIIIQALDRVSSQIQFHIVGITNSEYCKVFPNQQELILKLCEQNRLFFYGRRPHAESIELLKQADYSIFYRDNKRLTQAGFPTKFVESISCGIPVLTSPSSDLRKYLASSKNGILIPMRITPDEMASVLNSLQRRIAPPIVQRDLFDFRNYSDAISNFLGRLGV